MAMFWLRGVSLGLILLFAAPFAALAHDDADTRASEESRAVIAGNLGRMPWKPMFDGSWDGWSQRAAGGAFEAVTGAPDGWEVVGEDGIVGDNRSGSTALAFGEPSWRNVELSARVTPLAGGNAAIMFRIDEDGDGWYTFDLMLGWQVAAIYKLERNDEGSMELTKLSTVNYALSRDREYDVQIAARDHSITTYIDGELVNQLTDDTWPRGRVALNIWHAKTQYRNLRYRVLDEN
ncbi:hypothetical protein CMK11_06070 [Candidatus Poribacteria bacterium]|nr:hypothetical protein [Candidatus Poribacteria bacterium]